MSVVSLGTAALLLCCVCTHFEPANCRPTHPRNSAPVSPMNTRFEERVCCHVRQTEGWLLVASRFHFQKRVVWSFCATCNTHALFYFRTGETLRTTERIDCADVYTGLASAFEEALGKYFLRVAGPQLSGRRGDLRTRPGRRARNFRWNYLASPQIEASPCITQKAHFH